MVIVNKKLIIEKLPTTNGKLTKDATINWYYTLKENLDIPAGITLTVEKRAKLIIGKTAKLTIKQGGKLEQKKIVFLYMKEKWKRELKKHYLLKILKVLKV